MRGRNTVSTSGSRIDAGDFTQGRGNTDDDERHGNPTPDDVDGTATDEGVHQGSRKTVGDRGQDEGHEGDLESRAVARQLRLVTQVLEELVGACSVAERGLRTSAHLLRFGIHGSVAAAGRVALADGRRHDGGV